MSARSIATLTVSFGMVSIPVKLFSATEASRAISFNLLHKGCGSRLRQQYICIKEDVPVSRDEMVKGYEFSKDQYVVFTEDEIKSMAEEASKTIEITEFVPLSFIPFNTLLGRTHGIEEISIAENLKHTAVFRLALGKTITNLQASWVKMGLDAATEALRWGVNDLGGTLMEENISRMAGSQHGVRLEPEQLIEAARAAGRVPAQRTTLYELIEAY